MFKNTDSARSQRKKNIIDKNRKGTGGYLWNTIPLEENLLLFEEIFVFSLKQISLSENFELRFANFSVFIEKRTYDKILLLIWKSIRQHSCQNIHVI